MPLNGFVVDLTSLSREQQEHIFSELARTSWESFPDVPSVGKCKVFLDGGGDPRQNCSIPPKCPVTPYRGS